MEKQPGALDVSEIMEQIRADIKKKGYRSDMLSFADVPPEEEAETSPGERFDTDLLHAGVRYCSENHEIPLPEPPSGIMRRRAWESFRRFLEPYIEAQNALNENLAEIAIQMERYMLESRLQSPKAILDRLDALELRQRNAEMQMEQLQEQIRMLQERLEQEEGA